MAKAVNQPEDLFELDAAALPSASSIIEKALAFEHTYD